MVDPLNNTPPPQRSIIALTILLTVLVGAFTLASLRIGHYWGGDFAQYILHAKSFSSDRAYAETGIIHNPHNIVLGPKEYPPGYPLVIAPIVAAKGADLYAIKVTQVGMLCGMLLTLPILFRELGRWLICALIILAGLNPLTWFARDAVQSEHLFCFVWYLTLLFTARQIENDRPGPGFAIVTGLLFFLTCQTRTAGFVLLPAIVIADLFKHRKLTRHAAIAITVTVALTVAQKCIMHSSGSGYLEQLSRVSISSLTNNVQQNAMALSMVFDNGHIDAARLFLCVVGTVLAVIGFVSHNRPRPRFIGIASVLYLVLITVWPTASGDRMIQPIVPAFFFYLLLGVRTLTQKPGLAVAGHIVPALMLITCVGFFASADYSPIDDGPQRETAQELFTTIQQTTVPSDVFLFFKPRVLTLYTGRSASAFPEQDSDRTWSEWAHDIQADFIIVRTSEYTELLSFMDESPDPMISGAPVFANRDFKMYRL